MIYLFIVLGVVVLLLIIAWNIPAGPLDIPPPPPPPAEKQSAHKDYNIRIEQVTKGVAIVHTDHPGFAKDTESHCDMDGG